MKTTTNRIAIVLILAFTFFGCQKDVIPVNKVPVSNAGDAQIVQLPVDSVLVSGTGTDEDGKIIGYLWSEVTGPNNAVIIYPGSPSTMIKGLITGSYVFQLMVTDDKGATGIDTVSIKVMPPVINTIVLQPANNPNEVHIWGNSFNEEASYNGSPELGASSWTHNGNPIVQRGLFQFDLLSIPSNATIVSAKLSLFSNPTPQNGDLVHPNSGSDNKMLIQRVTSSWTAATVKWTNQPTTTTNEQIEIAQTNQSILDLIDVDVTDIVKSMFSSSANYGFMIKLQNESGFNSRIFGSSFYSDASKHPKISIQYSTH